MPTQLPNPVDVSASRQPRAGSDPLPSTKLVTPDATTPRPELITVLLVRQADAWERGERMLVETLIDAAPEVRNDHDCMVDLLYHEFILRQESGEQVTLGEYARRFPELVADLRQQLELGDPQFSLDSSPVTRAEGVQTPPQPTRASRPSKAPQRIGRYLRLGKLGSGGMGIVYRVYDPKLKRQVALKTIKPERSIGSAEKERFLREAAAAAKLHHPHVVIIHDFGEHDGRPYFTMPLIAGGSFHSRLDEYRFGSPVKDDQGRVVGVSLRGWTRREIEARRSKILTLLEKVCGAVAEAHSKGIIHRDLKPSNILLDGDEPRVSDFGLAKVEADAELTPDEAFLGTPAYMSPEQHRGKTEEVKEGSDIWALGVILYELFTGRRPYLGEGRGALSAAVLEGGEVPRPRALNPAVDRDLEAVILRCLQREVEARYASGALLAHDLACLRLRVPTVARPENHIQTCLRISRRHYLITTGVGLLAMAGAGLPLVAYYKDPDRRLKPMLGKLRDGHRVVLVPENGPPRWSRWRGVPGSQGPESATGLFTLHTGFSSLLELLPDPQQLGFRLKGEVRNDGGDGASFGFYICHTSHLHEGYETHCFIGLRLAALTPAQKEFEAAVFVDYLRSSSLEDADERIGYLGKRKRITGLREWHRLSLAVSVSSLEGFVDEQSLGRIDSARALEQAGTTRIGNPRLAQIAPEYSPRGALGLYLHHCSASFRNVTIEPIPSDSHHTA